MVLMDACATGPGDSGTTGFGFLKMCELCCCPVDELASLASVQRRGRSCIYPEVNRQVLAFSTNHTMFLEYTHSEPMVPAGRSSTAHRRHATGRGQFFNLLEKVKLSDQVFTCQWPHC